MKISELFLHVQIQVVTYLWCQINPSITGLVLTLVLSAQIPDYAVFRRTRFTLLRPEAMSGTLRVVIVLVEFVGYID